MMPVQEGLLGMWLQPHLVGCVLRQVVQTSDLQPELASLRELAETRAEGGQVLPADVRGLPHNLLADVVHPILVQSEAVLFILAVDEEFQVTTDTAIARRQLANIQLHATYYLESFSKKTFVSSSVSGRMGVENKEPTN
jgi:hypothetical protein